MIGGFGNLAWGRHQHGAPASDVSPTFYASSPNDEEANVSVNRWVEFFLHSYSSTLDPSEVADNIEISEDGGTTYVWANTPPYALTVRAYDGQKTWIKVLKAGPWNACSTIVFRVTCSDEYGNACVKEVPVEWPE